MTGSTGHTMCQEEGPSQRLTFGERSMFLAFTTFKQGATSALTKVEVTEVTQCVMKKDLPKH